MVGVGGYAESVSMPMTISCKYGLGRHADIGGDTSLITLSLTSRRHRPGRGSRNKLHEFIENNDMTKTKQNHNKPGTCFSEHKTMTNMQRGRKQIELLLR